MKEVWKDIQGYEGYYQVSNKGRVKSLDRCVKFKHGKGTHFVPGKVLKPSLNIERGYLRVSLTKHNRSKFFRIHRLVAEAFIPNPKCLPQVNHKDENRLNNYADNLEWCTNTYNNRYGTRTLRASESAKKPVAQLDECGHVIRIFQSAIDAENETGVNRKSIQGVASMYAGKNGKIRKRAGGYKWEYMENLNKVNKEDSDETQKN